jgi:2-polyprenyl-6-methoxyphenol hydroxylase-like FAD-dependent oxidoreductase
MSRMGEDAVVVGGSIAGLITASVLSAFFEQVTVLERDQIDDRPGIHKSIPQGNHLHLLLLSGQRVLSKLYPGFTDKLQKLGAVRVRWGMDNATLLPDRKSYSPGGAVREPRDLGIDLYCQSRGLLEFCVRQCTRELTNVRFQSNCNVERLIYRNQRVGGVVYEHDGGSHPVTADLVVDTGGRGAHALRWLKELGFPVPRETSIGVDVAYASTKYEIPNYSEPEKLLAANVTGFPNLGAMEEIEGNVFHLTVGGRFGDYPPVDEAGFLAFTKSLYTPMLYELVKDAKRISEITPHRFPTAMRRHYERLETFPEGFLVLGDAVCSFNPVYGQGMSSAALQAEALQELLIERAQAVARLGGLPQEFFARAAEVVSTPWTLAANADFVYPQTKGERPKDLEEGASYFMALEALSAEDVKVQTLVAEVLNLVRPLSDLSAEPLRTRVMEQQSKRTNG